MTHQAWYRKLCKIMLQVFLCASLWLIVHGCFVRYVEGRNFPVPPLWARQVRERVPLLRPGMTEQEVWSTLGLSGWGFKAHIYGSGPSDSFPANYELWPGYALHMRWNYRNHPHTLVQAKFGDRL